MSKRKKRIEKLRRRTNLTAGELDTIMTHDLGCAGRQHSTSHKTYRHPDGQMVTVPQTRSHIKRAYVDEVIEKFKPEIEAIESEDDND